ncbi:hypothetical protein J5N97_027178 [Dioscorea zingiberensis]|uniref:Receptor-like serine/threonine-protein kinase n=1 Tax=Dioscorea zingiberensis TaxID=325984 RepID=A0A9D5C4D3_9LILI|nr:hypothetical protein J5N97_027178 [Dioscorea zingiberensis]
MAIRSCRNSLFVLIVVLFCCFSIRTNTAAGDDTISLQQPLSGNQTIVSKGGMFELGFFTPGNKSQNHYIGIWYKKRPERTVIWVANREKPASSATTSELTISRDGNLVLLDQSKNLIWSSNLTSTRSNSTSTVAVILDTGNLVLTNQSDTSMVYWQSFDHPTDSWLPGGRVGWNNITKQYMTLVSWRSEDDPAPGSYSFGMDPTGVDQLVQMWNGSVYYWTSGRWNGEYFSSVPELTRNQVYKYIYNESENYLTYTIDDAKVALVTRFQADVSGLGIQWAWLNTTPAWLSVWSQPKLQCQIYSFCGPFSICTETGGPVCSCLQGFEPASKKDWDSGSWKGGCVRRTSLLCENNSTVINNGQEDKFSMIPDMQLPVNSKALLISNVEQCQVACLNNCSCTAYAYNGSACLIWSSELLNLQQPISGGNSPVGTLFLRLAASELQDSSNGVSTGAIVGAVVGGVVLCLGIILVLIWIRRKRSQSRASFKQGKEGSLVVFSYRELEALTKNFSERLGGGGFGSVFKGVLPDKTTIAVKKLEGLRQGEKQFRAEVSTMGTIQHVNLVRLRGFCCEGDKRLLVYDFMPNGSLDSYLTDDHAEQQPLGWKQRYQIAIGTARGLAYLHEQCRDCIMHCDIKPENILLDKDLCPKVSDFGMAKLMGRDISRVMTTMRGTVGYLAPEWITGLPVTPKADVYSYGMVLFELISGKRNATVHEDGQVTFFPVWATKRVVQDDVVSLLDKRLEGDADIEQLGRVCRAACWCIQDEESQRPTMGQVVQMLEGVVEIGIPPVPNTLQRVLNDEGNALVFFASGSHQDEPTNIIYQ